MKDQDLKKFHQFEEDFKNADTISKKYNLLKNTYYFLESYDRNLLLLYLDKLIDLSIVEKDTRGEHIFYLFKSNYYLNIGAYDKSLLLYIKSKNYFHSVSDFVSYYKVLSDIAFVMVNLGLTNHAVNLWKEILSKSDDVKLRHTILINLITASFESFHKFESSELYIKELLDYYEKIQQPIHISYCKANALMGLYCLRSKKQLDEALTFSLKAYHIAVELNEFDAQFEICKVLSQCYEAKNQTKNKIAYLLKSKNVIADNPKFIKAIPIYNSLYEHYKSINDFKNALKYFQLKHNLELIKFDQEIEVKNILNHIGFDINKKLQQNALDPYTKKYIFDFNRELFLENMKGDLIKVNIESIIYVEASNKMIKIHFVDKSIFVFKINLKEFWETITDKFGKDHLFFKTNLRSEIVNLSWMSKYDKLNKKLYINVLGEETVFELTRGQSLLLKDFFE